MILLLVSSRATRKSAPREAPRGPCPDRPIMITTIISSIISTISITRIVIIVISSSSGGKINMSRIVPAVVEQEGVLYHSIVRQSIA